MRLKRLISAFIACAMLVTFMPMQAFAADDLPEVAEYYESFDEESPMEIGARATRSETIELGESKTLVGKLGGLDKWGTSDPDVIKIDWSWGVHTAKITALQVSDDPIIITHTYGFAKEEQWEITVTPPAAKFFVLKVAGNEPENGADQGQDNYYPNDHDTIKVDGITYDKTTGLPGSLTKKGYELLQDNGGEYFALVGETPIDDRLVIEPGQKFMKALRGVAGLSDKQKIVWYVMKDQKNGYHVDGYVSNIPVNVTYKANYPDDAKALDKVEETVTGSEYSILSLEECGFTEPSGYTFVGWKLEDSDTDPDKIYEPDDVFALRKAETFIAQWEEDEESDGSTAAYFYVLKPVFSGDPSTATPENFYYVGQGSIENPQVDEAEGQRYTEPQNPVPDLPSDIAAKLENIVWYRVGQANGANSNGDTPIVSAETETWHVDGYLTAPLTVNAVNSENEQEFSGLKGWPKTESVRVGTEYTVVVGKDNNATIEVTQTITVDGRHYAYDAPKQEDQNGAPLSGKMQLNGATVKIPYAPDNNDNGDPDVTETRYAVTYTWDNAPAGSQLPSDQTLYLEGDTVDVDGTYTKDAVVKGAQNGVEGFYTFSGWSTQDVTITADNQFRMPEKDVTLNGTWTFTKDENGDKIPDERQIFVNYRSNAERYGTVSAEAANKVFTFTEEEIAAAKENGDKLSVRKLHAQATETSDGDFDRWTTNADFGTLFPVYRATLNVDVIFTVNQLGETLEVVANFDRETGGGGAHHPDARDDDDDDDDRDDDDEEEIIDEEVPLAETLWLNTEDHYAYIVGYSEDGTVRPNANISRAEVATIFFRLLTDEARDQFWMTSNNFSDVLPNDWCNNAVSTMVNMGIIQGYEDGTFRPNANITRAEFAAIAARFMSSGYDVEEDLFTDIANHWARESINDAAMAGWINGYEDGTFRPDAAITRAEAVTLVNNVLQRKPDADHMFDSMIKWPDNPEGTWYYEAIQEATNSHDYDLFEDAEYETWTALQENRDWAALEKDWVNTHRTGGEVA